MVILVVIVWGVTGFLVLDYLDRKRQVKFSYCESWLVMYFWPVALVTLWLERFLIAVWRGDILSNFFRGCKSATPEKVQVPPFFNCKKHDCFGHEEEESRGGGKSATPGSEDKNNG